MKLHTFETALDFGDLWDGPRRAKVEYARDGSMIILKRISVAHDEQNQLEVISAKAKERIRRQIELFVFNLDVVADAVVYDWDLPGGVA